MICSFLASSPAGAHVISNVESLKDVFIRSRYRQQKEWCKVDIAVAGFRTMEVDICHCVAKLQWTMVLVKHDLERAEIGFIVGYLVELHEHELKISAWMTEKSEEEIYRERRSEQGMRKTRVTELPPWIFCGLSNVFCRSKSRISANDAALMSDPRLPSTDCP